MKILIEMSREHYDSLLSRVPKESRLYSILMSSMIHRDSEAIRATDIVMTVCEDNDARALFQFAQQRCPEAASKIEQALKLARAP